MSDDEAYDYGSSKRSDYRERPVSVESVMFRPQTSTFRVGDIITHPTSDEDWQVVEIDVINGNVVVHIEHLRNRHSQYWHPEALTLWRTKKAERRS